VIVYDMPASEYHRLPRASKSGLDKIARSPAHYRCRDFKEPSKAMRIGTALHSLVLEGIAPLVMPEFSGKGSVAMRDEWKAAHEGALILSEDEAEVVCGMSGSIAVHPIASTKFLHTEGRSEVSALWTCPDTGVECKSRFDWLIPREIVDLKTTADASAESFAKSVANFRYHVQDAFYSQAAASLDLDVEQFTFVCVETAPITISLAVIASAASAAMTRAGSTTLAKSSRSRAISASLLPITVRRSSIWFSV